MPVRKGSHSVFSVHLHLVFVTHYRRQAIDADMLERIEERCAQVCKKMSCQIIEFSGESDHVHLLVDFHPKNSISAVAGSLKSSTSRMIKREFPQQYEKHYWGKTAFWSNSYYVSSAGGAPIEMLKRYIQQQDRPQE